MRSGAARLDSTPIEVRKLGIVDYEEAYDLQHSLAAQRATGELDHDVLLLLEHPSIYTAGKRTEDADRPTDGSRVIDVDRGGRITWHGPGQLVGYPIVRLAEPLDVVEYVRRIEEALIRFCGDQGLQCTRVEGRSGVWVVDGRGAESEASGPNRSSERKLGQIGIRVSRGVTLHGFALNVDPDLSVFAAIVPCGIPDAGVTSLSAEIGRPLAVNDTLDAVAGHVQECLDETTRVGSVQ